MELIERIWDLAQYNLALEVVKLVKESTCMVKIAIMIMVMEVINTMKEE
jgi:hypothetical protein